MDYELLEKAAMTKYEMSKKDPFRFFMRSIVAGLYLGLATILSYTLAVLLIGHHVIASKIAFAGAFGIGLVIIVLLGSELRPPPSRQPNHVPVLPKRPAVCGRH